MEVYIGRYKILADRNELIKYQLGKSKRIKLEPLPMKVLTMLIKNKGKVVHRSSFIDEIWDKNDNVGEKALNKCISRIRDVFEGENIIETIPKSGYSLTTSPRISSGLFDKIDKVKLKIVLIFIGLVLLILILIKSHILHIVTHRLFG